MTADRWQDTEKQKELGHLIACHKYILAHGGSRSGKTARFCQSIVYRAYCRPSRHAILRYHFSDVKQSVGLDTLPRILELMGIPYTLNRSDWYFVIPAKDGGESEIWLCGLDDKERTDKILGKEFSTIYLNEASQISYHAYTTALTRLAENSGLNNKVFIDCNPPEKSHWLYQVFVQHKQPDTAMDLANPGLYAAVRMNPADNPHLPEDYISEVLAALPERQQRRFLYGEWLDRREGSLFSREHIEHARVSSAPQYLSYAVAGIDPAVSSGEASDETGIVSVGRACDGDYYVLRDDSVRGTPGEWAGNVSDAYRILALDGAVYETNQGGEMVEHTIHVANPRIPCHGVRATRGKAVRAEPVAALYEQGKVHHVGCFPELEDQMIEWVPGDAGSPDRMDALVWAVTYLMDKPAGLTAAAAAVPATGTGGFGRYAFGRSEPPCRPPVFGGSSGRWRRA